MNTLEAFSRLKGKTVAIDFDGVLHSYSSGWTGPVPIDPPMGGAVEFVRALVEEGVVVVVHTTRADTDEGWAATVEWLEQHGFPAVTVQAIKPKAVAYIDDRAVVFRDSWSDALTDAAALVDLHPRPWQPSFPKPEPGQPTGPLTDDPDKVTKLTGPGSVHEALTRP